MNMTENEIILALVDAVNSEAEVEIEMIGLTIHGTVKAFRFGTPGDGYVILGDGNSPLISSIKSIRPVPKKVMVQVGDYVRFRYDGQSYVARLCSLGGWKSQLICIKDGDRWRNSSIAHYRCEAIDIVPYLKDCTEIEVVKVRHVIEE